MLFFEVWQTFDAYMFHWKVTPKIFSLTIVLTSSIHKVGDTKKKVSFRIQCFTFLVGVARRRLKRRNWKVFLFHLAPLVRKHCLSLSLALSHTPTLSRFILFKHTHSYHFRPPPPHQSSSSLTLPVKGNCSTLARLSIVGKVRNNKVWWWCTTRRFAESPPPPGSFGKLPKPSTVPNPENSKEKTCSRLIFTFQPFYLSIWRVNPPADKKYRTVEWDKVVTLWQVIFPTEGRERVKKIEIPNCLGKKWLRSWGCLVR